MSAFAVDPIFTASQAWWFAGLMTFGLMVTFIFSPRRREKMGNIRFMLASALFSAPALAGVTLVRGAYRLGYREEGRSFFEANMRSMVWMIGAVFLGQMVMRFVPPMSGLMRDYRRVDGLIWRERLGRWFGSNDR